MSNIKLIEVGSPEYFEVIDQAVTAAVKCAIEFMNEKKTNWDWVDDQEAMKLLSCKKTKLQQLRDSGDIAISQPSKKEIYYSISSINKYILKHKVK